MWSNSLLEKIARGERCLGLFVIIPDATSSEILARSGFDWLCLDLQHGLYGIDRCIAMLQAMTAAPASAIVRLPSLDAALIGKVLDAGAHGVMLPDVETGEEAANFVAACRYRPKGVRSVGAFRAQLVHGGDYGSQADDKIVRLAMVETVKGMDNVKSIAATEGLHGVFFGPADLRRDSKRSAGASSIDLNERILEAGAIVMQTGLAAGVFTENPAEIGRFASCGFSVFGIGVDARLLRSAANDLLGHARGAAGAPRL
jgi:4-hydroxy-2-oxoheptanedioate aldolase